MKEKLNVRMESFVIYRVLKGNRAEKKFNDSSQGGLIIKY